MQKVREKSKQNLTCFCLRFCALCVNIKQTLYCDWMTNTSEKRVFHSGQNLRVKRYILWWVSWWDGDLWDCGRRLRLRRTGESLPRHLRLRFPHLLLQQLLLPVTQIFSPIHVTSKFDCKTYATLFGNNFTFLAGWGFLKSCLGICPKLLMNPIVAFLWRGSCENSI